MGDTNTAAAPSEAPNQQASTPAPSIAQRVLDRVKGSNPELKDFKLSVPVKSEEARGLATPQAPAGDKPADGAAKTEDSAQPNADTSTSAGDGDGKPGEGQGDEGDDEIKPEDSADIQLAKLNRAQKKTLKRIDKLTQERNELQRELEEARGKQPEAPGPDMGALMHVTTLDQLTAEEQNISQWLEQLMPHTKDGYTYKDTSGKETTLTGEEVLKDILYWTSVQAKQVPARRQWIENRDKTRTETAEKFKPWTNQKGFTEAKTTVEKTMQPASAVLPDFDLAVHERALGRLAMSGDWELVPKRKQPAGGVESAPAKKPAEAPPAAPPSSGGPPMKPAGTGPDLQALQAKMLAEPGNTAAVQAYVRAKLAASRTA